MCVCGIWLKDVSGLPLCLHSRQRYSCQICVVVQNEIKYNIMHFTCKIQNERKGMISTFFPLNFLVSCQMDLVSPFLVKNHWASATTLFKPVQFAWGTSSKNVLWAVLCECSEVFQLVDYCPHCMFTFLTLKPNFVLPPMSTGHSSSSLNVTQQWWQATGVITSSKIEMRYFLFQ